MTYSWSAAGALTSVSANGTSTSYTTNGDGQRASSVGGGVTHTFVWDVAGLTPVITRTPDLGLPTGRALLSDGTHSFIYGPDGLPIEQIDNAGHALFLDEDAQGSVRLLTDAAGNVKGTASYDAFGNQTAQSGEASPFGYDGMYLDAESGLYAVSGGVYDPPTGQYLAAVAVKTATNRSGISISPYSVAPSSRVKVRFYWDRSSSLLSPYGVPGGDPVNGVGHVRPYESDLQFLCVKSGD
jgi:RHS repeat-associated protein